MTIPAILSTKRLILRQWTAADLQPFITMNSDPDVMRYFPAPLAAPETAAMVERIKAHFQQHKFGLFAVEHKTTAAFMGFTGLAVPSFNAFFTPCIEIGWRFKKEFWGQGFATEAAIACLQYGFAEPGLTEIYSFTSVHNLPSEKLMQRIGMKYLSTFDHPKISKEHTLCPHVLYKITNEEMMQSANLTRYPQD